MSGIKSSNGGAAMGMSMIEFIDRRISGYCSDPTLYDVSPFSLADFRDCFIMELIKDAYKSTRHGSKHGPRVR